MHKHRNSKIRLVYIFTNTFYDLVQKIPLLSFIQIPTRKKINNVGEEKYRDRWPSRTVDYWLFSSLPTNFVRSQRIIQNATQSVYHSFKSFVVRFWAANQQKSQKKIENKTTSEHPTAVSPVRATSTSAS